MKGFTASPDMRASLVAQLVKNLPAMQETCVQYLGWENPLEKGKANHSSILAWRIPWTVQSMGSHTCFTHLCIVLHTYMMIVDNTVLCNRNLL